MTSNIIDAHTEVKTERISYNWSIKTFDLLPHIVGETIYSPWFYSKDGSENWRLKFCPRGERRDSSESIEYVALYLQRDSPKKSLITLNHELKISISNIILKNLPFTSKFQPQDTLGYRRYLERSKILNSIQSSTKSNELIISCIIDIPMEVTTSVFDRAIFDSEKVQLSDDLRLLFENPIFSDFTIVVGDQRFPTHRNMLAQRSPVFAAMFEHKDLMENRKNEVKIENIKPSVIKGMLEFIYTDQVTNLKELANGLLEVADKYDLRKLRAMCEKTLYEGLNKKNAAQVLQLADLHHAETLKKCVMKYIVTHVPELVKSDNWIKAGCNLELLVELYDQLILPQAVNVKKS